MKDGSPMKNRYNLDREKLAAEMRHAAQKGIPFTRLMDNLIRDYKLKNVDDELRKRLQYNYNTLLFIVEERKNRYGRCG